jgi:hypothetical protein
MISLLPDGTYWMPEILLDPIHLTTRNQRSHVVWTYEVMVPIESIYLPCIFIATVQSVLNLEMNVVGLVTLWV